MHRLIYLSIVGSAPDATSVWMRGRWEAEEYLLHTGLDVTVLRPVQVVGIGGAEFDLYVRLAREPVAIVPGNGQQKMNCTLDDLLYYLVGVLAEPRTFGQRYDVGDDEELTSDRMIDIVAEIQGHTHPHKFHLSLDLVVHTASFIEHGHDPPRQPDPHPGRAPTSASELSRGRATGSLGEDERGRFSTQIGLLGPPTKETTLSFYEKGDTHYGP